MRVLVHLGLNKCASTFIQKILSNARTRLAQSGTWYPVEDGRTCHYGLSRHYGFGPDAPEVTDRTIGDAVNAAAALGCNQLILSSEYLSLYRPRAAERLMSALDVAGCEAEFLLFSRDIPGWIKSLFNQYVRTVDGGKALPHIDAFVDQVLRNRTIDVVERYEQWSGLVTPGTLRHYRLGKGQDRRAVLKPFSTFCGFPIPTSIDNQDNVSVGAEQLFRIGQLRANPRNKSQEAELQRLLSGASCNASAPADYLTISADRLARIESEITSPYEALPWLSLNDEISPRFPASTDSEINHSSAAW